MAEWECFCVGTVQRTNAPRRPVPLAGIIPSIRMTSNSPGFGPRKFRHPFCRSPPLHIPTRHFWENARLFRIQLVILGRGTLIPLNFLIPRCRKGVALCSDLSYSKGRNTSNFVSKFFLLIAFMRPPILSVSFWPPKDRGRFRCGCKAFRRDSWVKGSNIFLLDSSLMPIPLSIQVIYTRQRSFRCRNPHPPEFNRTAAVAVFNCVADNVEYICWT